MNPDQLLKQMREREPEAAEVERAVERVRERLFPKAETGAPAGAIRSCGDFAGLIPAYLAGSLDAGRKLLFEVHTRECVGCRKALAAARGGAGEAIEFRPRKAAGARYTGWAIAAAAVLSVGSGAAWVYLQYPALGGGPRATVATVEGGLMRVAGSSLLPLAPGAVLGENDAVQTAKNSNAVLVLNDGSRIELNQRARISVTRDWSGSTIHLAQGDIIVEAAKQRRGSLRVVTPDCDVSVKGTIFSVDAGTLGSRVAVAEGTVWVDHGKSHEVLKRGGMTSTRPDMTPEPIAEQFEWSRNSAQYMALLAEFREIRREIDAIPSAGLRYDSALVGLLPADVAAVAAIPNLGGAVGEASRIFHERVKQSESLGAWYRGLAPAARDGFEKRLSQFEAASAYLGDEIVVAAAMKAGKPAPMLMAKTVKPGLREFLEGQFPSEAIAHNASFENGLFVAAADASDLARVGEGFEKTELYRRLTPVYIHGTSWLFAADVAGLRGSGLAVQGARFLVAESRTVAGRTENRASATFEHGRQGVASWLSTPGPMGSLDFVSPDAGFAASLLLKNPALIVDDIMAMAPSSSPAGAGRTLEERAELAAAFGGEVTVALDGPLLPVPSWKIAAEVAAPERLQTAMARIVAAYNAQPGHDNTGNLELTQSQDQERTYYRLRFEKLPWEAHWTFVDGYWLAAANRELLVRSIQNRQTGYVLAKAPAFLDQLPREGGPFFSAVVYHHLGQTLAPLIDLFGARLGPKAQALRRDDTPSAITFRARNDSIEMATIGSLGMDVESLLSMQGAGPLQMLTKAIAGGTHK